MKHKLLASACALCTFSVLAGIAAAQFNPNSPAPSQSPSNVPSQPGSLVSPPGSTNIGIPSQNVPGARVPQSTEGGGSKKGAPVTKEVIRPGSGQAGAAGSQKGIKTSGSSVSRPTLVSSDRAILESLRGRIGALADAEELAHLRDIIDGILKGNDPLAKAQLGALAGGIGGSRGRETPDPKRAIGENFSRPIEPKSSERDKDGPGADGPLLKGDRYGGGDSSDRRRGGVFGFGPGSASSQSPIKDPSGMASENFTPTGTAPRRSRGNGYTRYERDWTGDEGGSGTTVVYEYDSGASAWEVRMRSGNGSITSVTIAKFDAGDKFVAGVITVNGNTTRVGSDYEVVGEKGGNAGQGAGDRALKTAVAGAQRELQRNKGKTDQPVAEGTGRASGGGYQAVARMRGGRQIICDYFGCRETASTSGTVGDPGRDNPDGPGATPADVVRSGTSPGPGAAGQPCPDCGPSGGGGGAKIRGPSDGPDFGPGGPGAPPK
jgi:hypothetical protein